MIGSACSIVLKTIKLTSKVQKIVQFYVHKKSFHWNNPLTLKYKVYEILVVKGLNAYIFTFRAFFSKFFDVFGRNFVGLARQMCERLGTLAQ